MYVCILPVRADIIDSLLPKAPLFITHKFDSLDSMNDAFHLMHTPEANCIRPVFTLSA